MSWIVGNIDWIMVVSGGLTMTMLLALVAPKVALKMTFGDTVDGPLAVMLVRNWGLLVALSGALVIYGGLEPAFRTPVLVAAVVGKVVFIGLILAHGRRFAKPAASVIAADTLFVLCYVWYLAAAHFRGIGG